MGLQMVWTGQSERIRDVIEVARIARLTRAISRWAVATTAMGRVYVAIDLRPDAAEDGAAALVGLHRHLRREPCTLDEMLADPWQFDAIYLQGGLWRFAPGPTPGPRCCHSHD